MQAQRAEVRMQTDQLNAVKAQIDNLKSKLDKKENERKAKFREMELKGAGDTDAFGIEDQAREEIIDEEELSLLKQMKDYKKAYRDSFARLKEMKIDLNNNQQRIDVIKEQLIEAFEQWYRSEFEVPDGMVGGFDNSMDSEYKDARHETDSNAIDED